MHLAGARKEGIVFPSWECKVSQGFFKLFKYNMRDLKLLKRMKSTASSPLGLS